MISQDGITHQIARYAAEISFDDLPNPVVDKVKSCLVDWMGVTLAGACHPISEILVQLVLDMGGKEQASIVGKGFRTNTIQAALVNGSISHVLDYDDVHVGMIGHPSVVIAPAILSGAEYIGATGEEIITAYAVGFDIASRLGTAVRPHHYEKGWHATSTVGRFGAAAGVGRLLGLDHLQMVHALGIVGTQSSGFRQVFGSMCKAFHAGSAAASGIQAALLAKAGLTSSKEILEGKHGFFELMAANTYDPEPIFSDLGCRFEIMDVTFKPHAACGLTHSTIDAVIALREEHNLNIDEVEKMECEVFPLAIDVVGNDNPTTGLEGKFSLSFCAALALIEGKATESLFTDMKVNDPIIKMIMERVKVIRNPELKYVEAPQARVTIYSNEKGVLRKRIDQPKGRPKNPLSSREMEEKFMELATKRICAEDARKILDRINKLDKEKDIRELMTLCMAPRGQTPYGYTR